MALFAEPTYRFAEATAEQLLAVDAYSGAVLSESATLLLPEGPSS